MGVFVDFGLADVEDMVSKVEKVVYKEKLVRM